MTGMKNRKTQSVKRNAMESASADLAMTTAKIIYDRALILRNRH